MSQATRRTRQAWIFLTPMILTLLAVAVWPLARTIWFSFTDAALGGELEVPTLDGRVKLKIPEGTQTGKQFRLRGKGVAPVRGGGAGDLLCRVAVETPVNLSRRQRELLEELRDSLEGDSSHSPKASGWFDGVKRFFGDL